jgi:hypothetical protein
MNRRRGERKVPANLASDLKPPIPYSIYSDERLQKSGRCPVVIIFKKLLSTALQMQVLISIGPYVCSLQAPLMPIPPPALRFTV